MRYNKCIKKKGRISNPLFIAVNVLANTMRWLSFFFNVIYLFEQKSMSRGEVQREREAGSPLSRKHDMGLHPRTLQS